MGRNAQDKHSMFVGKPNANPPEPRQVHVKGGRAGPGLLNLPEQPEGNPAMQVISVQAPAKAGSKWGELTFAHVQQAYAQLQNGLGLSQAHYGPYALVLYYVPYADTLAPLKDTLIMPADRIRPLVTTATSEGKERQHFYGTGTLFPMTGILLSIGGNTVDLVTARDATAAYVQPDNEGNHLFRVFERFALREKDPSAVVRLEFKAG
jgi:hypothetical protein